MDNWSERTELLLGAEACARLKGARVAVIGLGGVGAAAAEMLTRAGVGTLYLIDSDNVGLSNLNRQLIALRSTLGRPKTDVLRERLLDINPDAHIVCVPEFITETNIPEVFSTFGASPALRNGSEPEAALNIDYVIDAIDTLSPKIALIQYCLAEGLPLVSSMGSGAKMDATRVRIEDISKTRQCPLAHMLRKRLHKLGITSGFLAVFSEETPIRSSVVIEESRNKKSQVGTISYLPTVFGCVCAQAVIKSIADFDNID